MKMKKEPRGEMLKLHSIVWPAGAKIVAKKVEERLSFQERAVFNTNYKCFYTFF